MSAPGLAEALAAINACEGLSPAEQAQITAKVIADPRVAEGVGRTPAANIAATVKAILAAGGSVSEPLVVSQLRLLCEYRQRKGAVDEEVLGVIKKHYVNRLMIVSSMDEFLQLYRDAEERFGTSTKNAIIAVEPKVGLTVNGQLNFAQGSESFFFRGLSRGVPCVLKFPPTEALAKHEVKVFEAVPAAAAGKQYLVNVTLVSVDAPQHKLSRKAAILMPFFSSTLDSWPTSLSMLDLLSRVAESIFAALSAFHSVHLIHCDCKPGNIFIDTAGGAFLGDYDAVVAQDTPVQRCTFTFLPLEFLLLKQSNVLRATPAVDLAMLACTLARMVQLPLPSSSSFYVTDELLGAAKSKLDESTTAAARSVFEVICRCLVAVQQDPQYRTGQALRVQKAEQESNAAAADESSGNIDWSKFHALQESSKKG